MEGKAKKTPAKKAPAKTAAKKPTAPKKATATSAAKSSKKEPVEKPVVLSTPGAKMPQRLVLADDIGAAFILLFTKCGSKVNIMLVKENYEKWGAPGGGVAPGDKTPLDTAKREFKEETGYEMPTLEKEESLRFRNAFVLLGYTKECIEPKFGKFKRKGDNEILELRHVPCDEIYKWITEPTPETAIRNVFISMLMELKPAIVKFCAGCK